jgi:hypothetical protein
MIEKNWASVFWAIPIIGCVIALIWRQLTAARIILFFNILEKDHHSGWFGIWVRLMSGDMEGVCEGTRWAWYTLVQGHKQFILDQ